MTILLIFIIILMVWLFIYLIKESQTQDEVKKPPMSTPYTIPPPYSLHKPEPWRPPVIPSPVVTPLNNSINLLAGEKRYPPRAEFFSREGREEGDFEERFMNAFELKVWNSNKEKILEEIAKRRKELLERENNKQNQVNTPLLGDSDN